MAFGRGEIHTSQVLSNLTVKIFNDPSGFVAAQQCPRVPGTVAPTGEWYVYGKSNFRIEDMRKGRGTPSKTATRDLEKTGYTTERFGLRMLALDEDAREADTPIANLQADDAEELAEKVKLQYEKKVHDFVTNAANYAPGHSVNLTTPWDAVGSDPKADIQAGREMVRAAIGKFPNTLTLSAHDFEVLADHEKITSKYIQTGGMAANVTPEMVARVLKVDRILISSAVYDQAEEGDAVDLGDVWGDTAILSYQSSGLGRKSVHFARTFVSSELRTRSYRDEEIEGNWTDTDWKYGLKFIVVDDPSSGLSIGGYRIGNVRT